MNVLIEVSKRTYFEVIQSRILYNVVFLAPILFLLTFVAAEFSYGETARIVFDIGVGIISVVVGFIAIFMGSGLVLNEIENRTLYMVLSRSISRRLFLLGKIIGFSLVLVTNIIILGTLTLILYRYYGGVITGDIYWVFVLLYFEILILFLLSLMCSMFSGRVLSVLMTSSFWIAGHSAIVIKEMTLVKKNPLYSKIVDLYVLYMPNFDKLNLKRHVLENFTFANGHYATLLTYGLVWIVLLYVVTSFLFDRKELN